MAHFGNGDSFPSDIEKRLGEHHHPNIDKVIFWATPPPEISNGICCSEVCCDATFDHFIPCVALKGCLILPCCWPCLALMPIILCESCAFGCIHSVPAHNKTWILTDTEIGWIKNNPQENFCPTEQIFVLPLQQVTDLKYRDSSNPDDEEMNEMKEYCCIKNPKPKLQLERKRRNKGHQKQFLPADAFLGCPPEFYEKLVSNPILINAGVGKQNKLKGERVIGADTNQESPIEVVAVELISR